MGDGADVGRLVRASASGSEAAWNELVRRYSPLVLAVTHSYRLTTEDVRDVSQTIWLRLVENLANLREPEALPGWLATTTHRECQRRVRGERQVVPVDPQDDGALQPSGALQQSDAGDHDAGLLRAELRQALRDGLAELPERDQLLLRLRVADPPKSYAEISQILGMPVGSIGPTLRRSLDKLRETTAVQAYLAESAGQGKGGDQRELAEVE